jgi:Spy/CpxP family protein refolding chaperone
MDKKKTTTTFVLLTIASLLITAAVLATTTPISMQAFGERGEGHHSDHGHPATGVGTGGGNNPGIPGQSSHLLTTE